MELNKKLTDIQNKSEKIKTDIMTLLMAYDGLFREANVIYMEQRTASGNEGLEEFQRLLNVVRRNKDVMGSLSLGIKNIRPMGQFKFIEDEIPVNKKEKKSPAQIRRQRQSQVSPAAVDLKDIVAEKEPGVDNGEEN